MYYNIPKQPAPLDQSPMARMFGGAVLCHFLLKPLKLPLDSSILQNRPVTFWFCPFWLLVIWILNIPSAQRTWYSANKYGVRIFPKNFNCKCTWKNMEVLNLCVSKNLYAVLLAQYIHKSKEIYRTCAAHQTVPLLYIIWYFTWKTEAKELVEIYMYYFD
jgi:hypothetical protein